MNRHVKMHLVVLLVLLNTTMKVEEVLWKRKLLSYFALLFYRGNSILRAYPEYYARTGRTRIRREKEKEKKKSQLSTVPIGAEVFRTGYDVTT